MSSSYEYPNKDFLARSPLFLDFSESDTERDIALENVMKFNMTLMTTTVKSYLTKLS